MLQQRAAGATTCSPPAAHSVRDCVEVAFEHVGLDWRDIVSSTTPSSGRPRRPAVGDASKARRELGWEPQTGFEEMIALMVEHDLALLRA